ncbi:MAG TPA: SPOR domain-containing protein, partial [Spirochaetia bacterium]
LLLGALASLQAGDDAKARATLVGLAGQTGDPQLAVRALWVLYATAGARGDAAETEAMRARLSARFPAAPETALAADGVDRVVLAPGPDPFAVAQSAAPTAAPATAPTPSTTAAPPAKGTFSVQAGSFRMKENADDLVAELTKRGFTPVVIHDSPQGKDRFRVFAGAGLGADDARAVMTRLSQAGFSGFLVADK